MLCSTPYERMDAELFKERGGSGNEGGIKQEITMVRGSFKGERTEREECPLGEVTSKRGAGDDQGPELIAKDGRIRLKVAGAIIKEKGETGRGPRWKKIIKFTR